MKMLTTRDLIKILFLAVTTIIVQLEVIRENGYWIAGGNLAFPILLTIIFWWPSFFKKM